MAMSLSSNPATPASERLEALQSGMAAINQRLETLETKAAALAGEPRSAWSPPPELIEQVLRCTQQIFPGAATAEFDYDPENPIYRWCNIWVTSAAAHDDLRHLRRKWHEAVGKFDEDRPESFRLQVRRP